jgi:hypothetical protein
MRVGCTLQNCVEAGVFASRQQSRSEGAFRAASPAPIPPSLIGNGRDAIFMNRDVVEIAKAILHAFQPREELLPTLRRLLAREKVGEELRGVSHLLGLNAQLVTAAGVESGERFALLAATTFAVRETPPADADRRRDPPWLARAGGAGVLRSGTSSRYPYWNTLVYPAFASYVATSGCVPTESSRRQSSRGASKEPVHKEWFRRSGERLAPTC